MIHAEMVQLIAGAGYTQRSTWADLGAGAGNFTQALRDHIRPGATIHAVDTDKRALAYLQQRWNDPDTTLNIYTADFTEPLDLPPLDGVLMANSLHFIRQQASLLERVVGYIKPGGVLVIVEYDVRFPRPYIPYPVPWRKLPTLVSGTPRKLGERVSPSNGSTMYGAVISSP